MCVCVCVCPKLKSAWIMNYHYSVEFIFSFAILALRPCSVRLWARLLSMPTVLYVTRRTILRMAMVRTEDVDANEKCWQNNNQTGAVVHVHGWDTASTPRLRASSIPPAKISDQNVCKSTFMNFSVIFEYRIYASLHCAAQTHFRISISYDIYSKLQQGSTLSWS